MSDLLVRVLAVWDVCGCRWAAVVRSDNHEHIDALHKQLVGLVMVFAVTFDCADDVEVVERALAALPKGFTGGCFQVVLRLG